jgi:hypothetical protein
MVIPAASHDRTIYLTIHSSSGAGRFRLLLNPVGASFDDEQDELEVGIEGHYDDARMKMLEEDIFLAYEALLEFTDARYLLHHKLVFTADSTCFFCYDIVLKNSPVTFTGWFGANTWCVPARTDIAGAGIGVGDFAAHRGLINANNCPSQDYTNQNYARAIGATIAHEWGHYEFGLEDEYHQFDPPGRGCPHSVMDNDYIPWAHYCTQGTHHPANADYDLGDWRQPNQTQPCVVTVERIEPMGLPQTFPDSSLFPAAADWVRENVLILRNGYQDPW